MDPMTADRALRLLCRWTATDRRRVAERVHPAYVAMHWEWGMGAAAGVPTAREIEANLQRTQEDLMRRLASREPTEIVDGWEQGTGGLDFVIDYCSVTVRFSATYFAMMED